ncbi:hypothetical protein BDV95DRAFT_572261 [Massariosphaeria phaeospora]|uniref:AAA+ ATPase domain-containing protein n=1 Tax=Massariosphaeria phaeospora TaxID=100035 RepID=A0A7C8IDP8_9PLEO|nr:hypothetical protein BDV95DRAFT_572261 [Massariosphaeria phaeospora]
MPVADPEVSGDKSSGVSGKQLSAVSGPDQKSAPDILYEVRYVNDSNEHVYSRPLPRPAAEIENPPGTQQAAIKVVEVRTTWLESGAPELVIKDTDAIKETTVSDTVTKLAATEESSEGKVEKEAEKEETIKLPPFDSQRCSYIEILSPAIREALRTVVDYYPEHNLDTRSVKIYWPYPLLAHYDKDLQIYQEKFENHECDSQACSGHYVSKHIGILRNFLQENGGAAIAEERKRHERGYATFEMLWLLYRPGEDVLFDRNEYGEYEPYVVKEVDWEMTDGSIKSYTVTFWNMNADSIVMGPSDSAHTFNSFAGEKEITSLRAFPFQYLVKDKNGKNPEEVRKRFTDRGKVFFELRKKGCWDFKGYGTTFPRRPFEGLVMVDPIQYFTDMGSERCVLDSNFETDNVKVVDRECCEEGHKVIRSLRRPFRFAGYSKINPLKVKGLEDHQYFLCDRRIEAFVYKHREWRDLDASGIRPINYDKKMLDTLVLEPHIKKMIQSLTDKYIKTLKADEAREKRSLDNPDQALEDVVDEESAWSADFVKGKGEGLIFLLHGKPGVGKTYTAECIAQNAERPLLTLTCADIGTDPAYIESNLMRWFKRAKSWNAIMLLDEADIYMEHRMVQDLERNNLVAGFLRAMEYYKGILFLTTNRVGAFDEAFLSRINLTIYYKPFSAKARKDVWESFFSKLEREKEDKMRIHVSTRDYVEDSEELDGLQWNGREIRNAFQIAVALAETEGEKDARGRIIIKKDHIRSTVEMSRAFKHYMKKVHKTDEDGLAAARGNRYDKGAAEKSEETTFK